MELIQNEFFVPEKYPVRPKRSKVEILTARAAKVGIKILRNYYNLTVIAVITQLSVIISIPIASLHIFQ